MITEIRSKRVLSVYALPPHLSLSFKGSLLKTAPPNCWSWCILTPMAHTSDLWAVELLSNTARVYVPSLARMDLRPANSTSEVPGCSCSYQSLLSKSHRSTFALMASLLGLTRHFLAFLCFSQLKLDIFMVFMRFQCTWYNKQKGETISSVRRNCKNVLFF